MAVAPTGTKQKTYCVREDIARIIAMIASKNDRRESDVVTEALEVYIRGTLSADEMRVFGYVEEKPDDDSKHGTSTTNLPGTKKRSGKELEAGRRSSK